MIRLVNGQELSDDIKEKLNFCSYESISKYYKERTINEKSKEAENLSLPNIKFIIFESSKNLDYLLDIIYSTITVNGNFVKYEFEIAINNTLFINLGDNYKLILSSRDKFLFVAAVIEHKSLITRKIESFSQDDICVNISERVSFIVENILDMKEIASKPKKGKRDKCEQLLSETFSMIIEYSKPPEVISSLKTNFGGLFNWIKINYKQVIGLLVWVGFGAVLLGLIPSENNWNQYFMLVWIALLGLMGNYLFQKMNRPRKLEEK